MEPSVVTVGFVHLGCAKNLIDSEKMLGNLAGDGRFVVGADPDQADIVIVNTCGFLEASRAESISAIQHVLERKRDGKVGRVVVAGCLAQKDRAMIEQEAPGVDALIGVADRDALAALCGELHEMPPVAIGTAPERGAQTTPSSSPEAVSPILFRVGSNERPPDPDDGRLRLTPRHYAYVRTSEGCDHPCTFCSIPGIRGTHKSKPIEQIVHETEELAADGAREIVLIAQDTTDYGKDTLGERCLHRLLEALHDVPGIEWLRVLYAHPVNLSEPLIEALTTLPRVVPYLDMPIQHGVDRVLKRMLRRTTSDDIRQKVRELRERSTRRFFLRSTIIVGFPGETEAEFEELLEFLEEVRFDRLGCFAYSFEEDTPSARLDGHLPLAIRQERRARLMEAQQRIGFEVASSLVGCDLQAIIDRAPASPGEPALGRTYGDCPEEDPVIEILPGETSLQAGDIVMARVVEARGYDLVATVAEASKLA